MYKRGAINFTTTWLKNHDIIQFFIISEGKACASINSSTVSNIENVNHSDMLVFKGVMQKLNIEGINNFTRNESTLLSQKVCGYILTCILKLINYKYGRANNKEGEAEINKKCYYL